MCMQDGYKEVVRIFPPFDAAHTPGTQVPRPRVQTILLFSCAHAFFCVPLWRFLDTNNDHEISSFHPRMPPHRRAHTPHPVFRTYTYVRNPCFCMRHLALQLRQPAGTDVAALGDGGK